MDRRASAATDAVALLLVGPLGDGEEGDGEGEGGAGHWPDYPGCDALPSPGRQEWATPAPKLLGPPPTGSGAVTGPNPRVMMTR